MIARHDGRVYPNHVPTHLYLASIYGQLGRLAEAKAKAAEVLRLSPRFSVAQRQKQFQFTDEAVAQRMIDGLRRAGLPE